MSFSLRSALLGAALFSAQAAAVEFTFVSGNPAPEAFGNSYTQMLGGLTTTVTAWSTTGRGGRYQSAELEIYSGYGMGVCSRSEGVDCSNSGNMHALDNKGADDLILFRFSSAVQLDSLTLRQFGSDSDLSLWAGSGSLNLDEVKPAALGSATPFSSTSSTSSTSSINNIKTVDLSSFTGAYDWLAVSARLAQANDFAKLQTLTVRTASPVPEANSWAMLLAGLGLIGFAVRRRS